MIAGRYAPDREIGRGGSGPVWLGRDEVLGRPVALKQLGLLPGAQGTDLSRAEREARLGARLNHPNVVAVFDVAVDDTTGAWWLVMEYVEGRDLGRLVRERGPLTAGEAALLLRQTADALLAAHAADITHRDVKPSNILVDDRGQVKLTDFGIARVTTDATLTATGMVTGSPAYLAPEVAAGGRGDQASDVWAIGATAFYLLAGRPPYEVGDNVLGTLYRIVNEEPPRLEGAGPLASLLEGTMVRDPARRWSMQQVRDFLARVAAEPTEATRALTTVRAATPATATTVAAPVVVAGASHATTATQAVPTAPAPEPAGERARTRWTRGAAAFAVLAALVVLAALGFGLHALLGGESDSPAARDTPSGQSSGPSTPPAKPTERGMKTFIRDYVATVSDDPAAAWTMLTPSFQRASGGWATYHRFWEGATNGRVLSISANPSDLSVSYQVHFDHFHNGPGPTVLDLAFDHGRYRIAAEHTKGFVPAD